MRHGLVRFEEGEWAYLISLSSHSGFNVVLGVDQDGRLYKSYGHVCPSLLVLVPEGNELRSSEEFFGTETVEWSKRFRWVRVGT